MPAHLHYAGRDVALLTQHGKEFVIAPALEFPLGCSIAHVTGFDTDLLGTFTRETPRLGNQLEAARRKARKGMALSGLSLGIASEGSFGPDPFTGMFPWNFELLVWVDDELGIEIVGMAQGAARSGHLQASDWDEIDAFARREGFPEHQLILRPENQNDTRIDKGIADWTRLRSSFDAAIAQASNRQVFIETDLRAFANPTRMACIAQAAADLCQRLESLCPACQTPGFWVTKRKPGLICAGCGLPTASYKNEIWCCVKCEWTDIQPRKDRALEDPARCANCNP